MKNVFRSSFVEGENNTDGVVPVENLYAWLRNGVDDKMRGLIADVQRRNISSKNNICMMPPPAVHYYAALTERAGCANKALMGTCL